MPPKTKRKVKNEIKRQITKIEDINEAKIEEKLEENIIKYEVQKKTRSSIPDMVLYFTPEQQEAHRQFLRNSIERQSKILQVEQKILLNSLDNPNRENIIEVSIKENNDDFDLFLSSTFSKLKIMRDPKQKAFISTDDNHKREISGHQEILKQRGRRSTRSLTQKQIDKQPSLPRAETVQKKKTTKKQNKNLNAYNQVLEKFQENQLLGMIVCRDEEKKRIFQFLKEGIENEGQSQALYISGVPGIGKTASVLEVIRNPALGKFKYVQINGMNFTKPENIYCHLLSGLGFSKKVSRSAACLLLNDLFTNGKLPVKYKDQKVELGNKVILLDECDYMVTPSQSLLYNLLDWPSKQKSKLTIIMIANTMDFPERLKAKLQSRLGQHRLVYKPYTSSQIETIVTQRFLRCNQQIFAEDTINYVSKKIATISTDIRKTLSICRLAIEIAKEQFLKLKKFTPVSIEHIRQAYDKTYAMPYHLCLKSFPRAVKLILIAIAIEINKRGYNVAYLSQVEPQLIQFFQITQQQHEKFKFEPFILSELKQIIIKLVKMKLITIQEHLTTRNKQIEINQFGNIVDLSIQMNISLDDFKNSLKDDPTYQQFEHFFR